jgi:hypothetical protein
MSHDIFSKFLRLIFCTWACFSMVFKTLLSENQMSRHTEGGGIVMSQNETWGGGLKSVSHII